MNLNERKSKFTRATNKASLLFLYSSFHCHMNTFNDIHNWYTSDQVQDSHLLLEMWLWLVPLNKF